MEKGFQRKPDITEWMKSAARSDLPLGMNLSKMLKLSANKPERLRESGLPMGISYGPFASFDDLEKTVPEKERDKVKYFIRCVPKNYQENQKLGIKRKEDITWEEAKKFYSDLPEGSSKFSVQLFER